MKRLLVLFVAVLLAACGQKGSEYLGKWENVQDSHFTIEIERNGDNYLAKMTAPQHGPQSHVQTVEVPATLKDGQLEFKGIFDAMNISHKKATDTLLIPGLSKDEFRRAK
jgi:predicted small lipoprotein YifL